MPQWNNGGFGRDPRRARGTTAGHMGPGGRDVGVTWVRAGPGSLAAVGSRALRLRLAVTRRGLVDAPGDARLWTEGWEGITGGNLRGVAGGPELGDVALSLRPGEGLSRKAAGEG